jgi:lipopolysaccharide export system permease protein
VIRAFRNALDGDGSNVTLLSRYILGELLKVLLLTLSGLTLVIILVLVGREAVRQGLGPGPVLRLIPYLLPNALCYAIPATSLFAACSVYGRISAANEVVALKSLGISPMRAIVPGLILATVLSFIAVLMNDLAFSWGHHGLQRVVVQSVEEIAYGVLRTQRSYSTDRFAISVQDVDGKRLIRPTITFSGNGSAPTVTITAQEARLESNLDRNTLSIFLTNGLFEAGAASMVFPDTVERVIPLTDASRSGVSQSPSHLPLREIPEAMRVQRRTIRQLEESQVAEAAFAMITGELDELSEPAWQHRGQILQDASVHLNRLHTEPWRRWASGFSCLCFVCVGAPLAIWLRHADFMSNFGLCFFPILVGYYPLFMSALDGAKGGTLPAFSVWLGNLICVAIGVWLTRKVLQH